MVNHTRYPWLAATAGMILTVNPIHAATFGQFTYTDLGSAIAITDFTPNSETTVVIPDTIAGKPVTEIKPYALAVSDTEPCPTRITLPATLTKIEHHAISGRLINQIDIPNGVTSIGDFAFQGCNAMKDVRIPKTVTHLGIAPFYKCAMLEAITIDEENPVYHAVGYIIYTRKVPMEVIQMPQALKTMPTYDVSRHIVAIRPFAFANCANLTSLTFDGGLGRPGLQIRPINSVLTTIGESAFENTNIRSIALPESVTELGKNCFNTQTLDSVLMLGSPPTIVPAGSDVFGPKSPWVLPFTVFYIEQRTGWERTYSNRNTSLAYWGATPPYISGLHWSIGASRFTNANSGAIHLVGGISPYVIWMSAGDNETPYSYLTVTATSSNQDLLPDSNIAITKETHPDYGMGNYNHKLTIRPISGVYGDTDLSITVKDPYQFRTEVWRIELREPFATETQFTNAITSAEARGVYKGIDQVKLTPNIYGLYTPTQVQNLNLSTPLLQQDPFTGKFRLRIKAQKSTDLKSFNDIDLSPESVSVTPEGDLDVLFNSSDNAAFFRIRAQ